MQPSIFGQMVNAVVEHYDIIGAGVLVLIVYSVSRLLSGYWHKDDE